MHAPSHGEQGASGIVEGLGDIVSGIQHNNFGAVIEGLGDIVNAVQHSPGHHGPANFASIVEGLGDIVSGVQHNNFGAVVEGLGDIVKGAEGSPLHAGIMPGGIDGNVMGNLGQGGFGHAPSHGLGDLFNALGNHEGGNAGHGMGGMFGQAALNPQPLPPGGEHGSMQGSHFDPGFAMQQGHDFGSHAQGHDFGSMQTFGEQFQTMAHEPVQAHH